MIQKVQNLILLLERMSVLYDRTVGILEREKLSLITFDFEHILEVLREKDEVLGVLRSLDEDRLRIQDQFALIMQKDNREVTLRFLTIALKEHLPIEARRLSELRSELESRIDVVKSRIRINKSFTEKSIKNLQMIASNLNAAIRGRAKGSSKSVRTYTGKAKVCESKQEIGSLVEKRL
ncbi:flagellar protein FlgN [bacterium]|nr:flagellar protein FlgN [bacterium]